jgi:hypothetical protein
VEYLRRQPQRDLGYLFSGLLDLTGRLERTFVLPFSASTAAIRVSALSPSADRRALWVALRWLVRRFVRSEQVMVGVSGHQLLLQCIAG